MPGGIPVSRIATRSARGAVSLARFGNTLRVEHRQQPGELGVLDVGANASSPAGCSAFQRSFCPSGTITSLNSGLPRRETCTHGPDSASRRWPRRSSAPCGGSPRSRRRSPRRRWSRRSASSRPWSGCLIGTWIAIVWMLSVLVASTPGAAGLGIRCRFWNGRRSPRSKIAPRST